MSDDKRYPLLSEIQSPASLRQLPENKMLDVCDELRSFLIESVSTTGGHLGASLGTVELTVALHRVFNTPEDRLVWDVGHQTYPHKILTGRRERMDTMRKKGGLSGFPKRTESEYDTFGVGHSSTSISAALGMATASKLSGQTRKHVAIIGDGAMSGGMAFEALNNVGEWDADLLVILNDNDMSISQNVGGLNKYLTRILTSRFYSSARESSKKVLDIVPPMREFARRAEEHMKGMITPGTLFEELGLKYYGPVDGHDINELIQVLQSVSKLHGPKLLHIVTQKGKGYKFAEEDSLALHAVTPFNPETGKKVNSKPPLSPNYSQIFGEWLCDIAAADERVVGITPAMCEGSGMVEYEKCYPDRYFDVAIAEQHAVTFAAGLACEGKKPVVAIYSTFLQRAYDQLIHDVVIQKLPVLFAIDRAGLVGEDGATHAGSFDLSFLRCLPNMLIMAPADENECRQMLYTGYKYDGPAAVRYPRGTGPGVKTESAMTALPIGKAEIKHKGHTVALLAFGSMVDKALVIGKEINATVVNMRFVKPLDEALILDMARQHSLLITIEENATMGGAGSAVSEALNAHHQAATIAHIGIPDNFIEHGTRDEVLAMSGLDIGGLRGQIKTILAANKLEPTSTDKTSVTH